MSIVHVIRLMIALFALTLVVPQGAAAQHLNAKKLEGILGEKGKVSGDEFKISLPQKTLGVKVDGFAITPPMGLTSWVAFTPHGKGVMAMGDMVLLEEEFKRVQKVVVDRGLTITAIHNHFLRDKPKVMFMHIGGMGQLEEIGKDVRAVLDEIKAIRDSKLPSGDPANVQSAFDTSKIEKIIGEKGETSNGVFKITIGRPDVKLTDMGAPVSTFFGFNTWMAFQGTEEKAAVAGDFAMLENEVENVIRELVKHGIEVTAVHNHMVTENPKIFFLHFWGVDTPVNLAKGLKAGLDQTGGSKTR